MATSSSQSLRISTSKQAARLTPARKKFNTFIGRINRQRKRLAKWQEIAIFGIQRDLRLFKDIRKVKHWLKTYKSPFELLDELFFGFFEDDLR